MTSGASGGASGWRGFWAPYLVTAAGACVVATFNALSTTQEARSHHLSLPFARALLLEGSSVLVILALVPLIWRAARLWPPSRAHPVRFVAIHLACATAFSAVHVPLMLALRRLLPMLGPAWARLTSDIFLYEYRKDLLIYALMVALRIMLRQLLGPPRGPEGAGAAAPQEATFDIRDGARLIRTPVGEIAAAVSAGNYVEFKLTDGRAPLMRTTLAAVETELAPHGFTRTHRSWVVNAARVRGIEPSGSGDHRLTLEGGVEAPLSRRYAEALERLRKPI